MDDAERERRGEDARFIVNNELYKESWTVLREKLTRQLETEDLTDEQRLEVVNTLRALRRVRGYLEQIIYSGHLAAEETVRKRTILERMTRRA